MNLSIIIVNYNSKLLIEQCLLSIKKAERNLECEIIVVDNYSTDGSQEYLIQKFPEIKYIFNSDNRGFARACNQGFKISSGKYILFQNPDTIIPETCLKECTDFLESHKEAGALGVRMVNGKGKFLKESKRGMPSPSASFYKLFGLAGIFPTSKVFAGYYHGNLSERENNPVEVLSGAFMMVRREVFEKLHGFDEDFFMYGEDIDLSVRIHGLGYQNYYLGKIEIIHLKGGSTINDRKKVEDFYGAMSLFVKKHYGHKPAWVLFLNAGIIFRKLFAMGKFLFR